MDPVHLRAGRCDVLLFVTLFSDECGAGSVGDAFFPDLAVAAIGTSIARFLTSGGSFRALKDYSLAKGCDDNEEKS
jgi:hypothetical protein